MKKLFLLFACSLFTCMYAQTKSTSVSDITKSDARAMPTDKPITEDPKPFDPAEIDIVSQDDFDNELTVQFHCGAEGYPLKYMVSEGNNHPDILSSGRITQEDQIVTFDTSNWPSNESLYIYLLCPENSISKEVTVNPQRNQPGLQLTLSDDDILSIRYKFTSGVTSGEYRIYKSSDYKVNSTNAATVASGNVSYNTPSHTTEILVKHWENDDYVVVLFQNGNPIVSENINCGKKTQPSVKASIINNLYLFDVEYNTTSMSDNAYIEVMLVKKGTPNSYGNSYAGTQKGAIEPIADNSGNVTISYEALCEGEYKVSLVEDGVVTASTNIEIHPLGALNSVKVSGGYATVTYDLGSTAKSAYIVAGNASGLLRRAVLPISSSSYKVKLPSGNFTYAQLYVNGQPVPFIRK